MDIKVYNQAVLKTSYILGFLEDNNVYITDSPEDNDVFILSSPDNNNIHIWVLLRTTTGRLS